MPRDNRCMYMAHVYLYVCCSECVGMFVVQQPLLKIVIFSPGVLKNVVCLCNGCNGCCVFCCIVMRGAVGARVWEE